MNLGPLHLTVKIRMVTYTKQWSERHLQAPHTATQGVLKMAEVSIIEFSQDISEQEAPPPLPIGEYPAVVESLDIRTSATSGNEYLAVILRVNPDDYPADFDPDRENYPDGVILNYNRLQLDDTARNRYAFKKFCEALGAPMGKQVDPNDWVGMSCRVGIAHRPWEGEDRPNIKSITSL